MNKFLALLISVTILVWGVFLFKMSDKVDSQNRKDDFAYYGLSDDKVQNMEVRLDFKSLLLRLKPQALPNENAQDPFKLPNVFAPPAPKPRAVNAAPAKIVKTVPEPPAITLDAILPGSKPVAILKYRGESAVVCVGQKTWNVTVERIERESVKLRYEGGTFTIK